MLSLKKKKEIKYEKKSLLKSLAPTMEAEDSAKYSKYLNQILNDRDIKNNIINKNVAVSGVYGAGKSSILKTFFKEDSNVIYVSLASYIEMDKINGLKNNQIDFIETSILQQILYSVRPNKLPLSRIKRIDNNYNIVLLIDIIVSMLITLFIIIIFETLNIINIANMIGNNNYLAIIYSILISFIYLPVYYIIKSIHNNFSVKKVKINEVELTTEESEISVLNRNIDELIHFFMQTSYKIVVFEDIDRLNDAQFIFSKLKEINAILNNALKKENRTIQFIYAVSDTIFERAELRTKFFDFILPIVPYSSSNTSEEIFLKEYKSLKLDKMVVKEICRFISNPRIIYDIVNEYIIYKDVNNINEDDKKPLLFLCAYKVLFPKRFDILLSGKGLISYFFSNDFIEKEKDLSINRKRTIKKSIKSKLKVNPENEEYQNNLIKIDNMIDNYNYNTETIIQLVDDLKNVPIKIIPSKYTININENNLKLNSFEERMLRTESIKRDYKNLIIKNHSLYLTSNDEEVFKSIIEGNQKTFNFNKKIDNPDNVLESLVPYDFMYDTICIRDLFEKILTINSKEYLKVFYNYISSHKINFIFYLEKYNINILFNSQEYLDNIVDYISNNNIEIEKAGYEKLMCYTVSYARKGTDITLSTLDKYFGNIDGIEKIFCNNYVLLKNNLKGFVKKFHQINFSKDSRYKEFYEYVIKNKLFSYNFNLIESAVICLGYEFSLENILESSAKLNSKFKNIYNELYKDLPKTIEAILATNIRQHDSIDFLKNFINLHINNLEELYELLQMESISLLQREEIIKNYTKNKPI